MKLFLVAGPLLFTFVAVGCAPPAPQPPQSGYTVEVTRAEAIRAARDDAAHQYGKGWVANVDATLAGRYWLVELRALDGKGMRYAISARDGGIRQRSMFQ